MAAHPIITIELIPERHRYSDNIIGHVAKVTKQVFDVSEIRGLSRWQWRAKRQVTTRLRKKIVWKGVCGSIFQ